MRVLLVYPSFPDTFWSFRNALKFISKKAAFPPLRAAYGCGNASGRMGKKAD